MGSNNHNGGYMNCIRCGSDEFDVIIPACMNCGLAGEYLQQISTTWEDVILPSPAELNALDCQGGQ